MSFIRKAKSGNTTAEDGDEKIVRTSRQAEINDLLDAADEVTDELEDAVPEPEKSPDDMTDAERSVLYNTGEDEYRELVRLYRQSVITAQEAGKLMDSTQALRYYLESYSCTC